MSGRSSRIVLAVLVAAAACLPLAPSRAAEGAATTVPQWRWTGAPRVVVFGDVHGAYDELTALLRAIEITDDQGGWIGGGTHVVSLGDLVDRGDDSRRVLDLLMRLEDEARRAGGALHVLLGNHEIMNVVGDLRYAKKEEYLAFETEERAEDREAAYRWFAEHRRPGVKERKTRREFEEKYPPGYFAHRAAYSPEGRYGRWLLQRRTVIVIDRTAFVHGGLSEIVAELGGAEVNRRLLQEVLDYEESRRRLEQAGLLRPFEDLDEQQRAARWLLAAPPEEVPDELRSAALLMRDLSRTLSFGTRGPLWYRGTAQEHQVTEEPILKRALSRLDADRVVLGHTVTGDRRVHSRFDGRVLLVDTGMQTEYYKGNPAALILENDEPRVYYSDEGRFGEPHAEPVTPTTEPDAMRDEEIERFLRTAEVIKTEELGVGVTHPQRLTLRQGDLELRAVFKTGDSTPADSNLLNALNRSDRYTYDLAAYRLDRMLGIGMVPVAVERVIGRSKGAVQLWIEDAINEEQRVERNVPPADPAFFGRQISTMHLFDILIYNDDRNQGNLLFTPADDRLHLIDHTRAFRVLAGRPKSAHKVAIRLSPELRERLEALDLETLRRELGEWVHPVQLRSLLKRRDELLKRALPTDPASFDPRIPTVSSEYAL